MKTGHVNAVAALLLASGWVAAQAPLPITYVETPAPTSTTPAPISTAPAPTSTNPASTAPAANATVQPVRHQPPDEAIPAPPARIGAPPPVPDGVQPVTQVLPHGDYVDPNQVRPYTVWGNADFLMWRINNGRVPQINAQPPIGVLTVQTYDFLQTVNNNGTVSTVIQPDQLGYFPVRIQDVPGLPNNGNGTLGDHMGGRFDLGVWLTNDHLFGIEGSFFYLQQRSVLLTNGTNSANNQIMFTTPFADQEFTVTPGTTTIEPGTPPIETTTPATRTLTNTFPIFFIRQLDSTVTAGLSNSMWGAELNGRSTFCYFGPLAIGGLVGFRQLQFTENLDLNGNFSLTTPPGVTPTTDPIGNNRPDNLPATIILQTHDGVATKNYFYGGNIGMDFDYELCGFFVDLRTQVAMGGMHQRADILSFTNTSTSATALTPASNTSTPGGLLFNELDNGAHKRDVISFLPELNLKVGYQFCSWFRAYAGYDALYVNNVLRAGSVSAPQTTSSSVQASSAPAAVGQASAGTGVSNLTVTQPAFRFSDSNIWTQGFNFGFELDF